MDMKTHTTSTSHPSLYVAAVLMGMLGLGMVAMELIALMGGQDSTVASVALIVLGLSMSLPIRNALREDSKGAQ